MRVPVCARLGPVHGGKTPPRDSKGSQSHAKYRVLVTRKVQGLSHTEKCRVPVQLKVQGSEPRIAQGPRRVSVLGFTFDLINKHSAIKSDKTSSLHDGTSKRPKMPCRPCRVTRLAGVDLYFFSVACTAIFVPKKMLSVCPLCPKTPYSHG